MYTVHDSGILYLYKKKPLKKKVRRLTTGTFPTEHGATMQIEELKEFQDHKEMAKCRLHRMLQNAQLRTLDDIGCSNCRPGGENSPKS